MKTINHQNRASFSTFFAIGSFLFGTLLFAYYMFLPSDNLLVAGFLYVVTAAIFNLIILIHLIGQLLFVPRERTENTIRILILLSNIPIAYLYFNIITNQII